MATFASSEFRTPSRDQRDARARRLLEAWRERRDQRARDELFVMFSPLARHIALRFQRERESLDDLIQVAHLGLVKAIARYDLERGTTFASYATPTIAGEIRRHYRDHTWTLHIPRGLKELALDLERTSAAMAATTGRAPSVQEVAERLDVSLEAAAEAFHASRAGRCRSLDEPAGDGEGTLNEVIGAVDGGFGLVEDTVTAAAALQSLTADERALLGMRFFEELTQAEIAERIGVSQMQVSRLLRRTLARLNAAVEAPSARGL